MAELIAAMDAGTAYVNIHTACGASPATLMPGDFPPGEIRGQIALAEATPGTMPSTGGGFGGARGGWDGVALAVLLVVGTVGMAASDLWRRRRRI